MDSFNKYSDEYFLQIIESSSDCISTQDLSGKILVFNKSAERTFGYTKAEINKIGSEILFAHDSEFKKIQKEIEKTGKYIGEVLNRRKNGELFVSFLTANHLRDENGKIIGMMGVSRDISEKKKQELVLQQQLQENKELIDQIESLSEIATSVTNGIVETNTNNEITWCNSSFERITGYTREELIGNKPSTILRVPHFYQEEFDRIIKDRLTLKAPMQFAHYKKNGELFWILVETSVIYNEDGSVKKYVEICTEITDQKKAEISLVESEQNFREISETIEDVFYLYNKVEKQYEYISPNCDKILGASQDFFYSGKKHTSFYVFPEDQSRVYEADKKVNNGISYDIQFRMVVNDEIKWLRERANPIFDEDGRVVKSSGIVTDITEAKRNLELIEQQNQAINESLTYAKRIQEATLPNQSDIQAIFNDFFLIYQPKDYISGDLYVIDRLLSNDNVEMKAFIVADCTGHGVPGGILSILCNSLLKQSLTDLSINSPAEALNSIRQQLEKLFRIDKESHIHDGMDVGFCVYDESKQELHFAGANSTCVIIRNGQLIRIKGDRQHVGYADLEKPFTNHTIKMQKGDNVYLSTDGIVDQFGGDYNKKFLRKNYLELLLSQQDQPMEVQKQIILNAFADWKGNNEQTDDICVFGLKIN